jgi:hypothetical protein
MSYSNRTIRLVDAVIHHQTASLKTLEFAFSGCPSPQIVRALSAFKDMQSRGSTYKSKGDLPPRSIIEKALGVINYVPSFLKLVEWEFERGQSDEEAAFMLKKQVEEYSCLKLEDLSAYHIELTNKLERLATHHKKSVPELMEPGAFRELYFSLLDKSSDAKVIALGKKLRTKFELLVELGQKLPERTAELFEKSEKTATQGVKADRDDDEKATRNAAILAATIKKDARKKPHAQSSTGAEDIDIANAANSKVPNKVLCYNCGKPGHISRNCPEPPTNTQGETHGGGKGNKGQGKDQGKGQGKGQGKSQGKGQGKSQQETQRQRPG